MVSCCRILGCECALSLSGLNPHPKKYANFKIHYTYLNRDFNISSNWWLLSRKLWKSINYDQEILDWLLVSDLLTCLLKRSKFCQNVRLKFRGGGGGWERKSHVERWRIHWVFFSFLAECIRPPYFTPVHELRETWVYRWDHFFEKSQRKLRGQGKHFHRTYCGNRALGASIV